MSTNDNTYYMSWQFVDNILREFAARTSRSFDTHKIVAVARGGLPIATILAHQLGVQEIHTVVAQSYRGSRTAIDKLREDPVFKPLLDNCDYSQTLIVDDIADTGETMKFVGGLLPAARRFAMVSKPNGRSVVDYTALSVSQECWIHFPWEVLLEPVL